MTVGQVMEANPRSENNAAGRLLLQYVLQFVKYHIFLRRNGRACLQQLCARRSLRQQRHGRATVRVARSSQPHSKASVFHPPRAGSSKMDTCDSGPRNVAVGARTPFRGTCQCGRPPGKCERLTQGTHQQPRGFEGLANLLSAYSGLEVSHQCHPFGCRCMASRSLTVSRVTGFVSGMNTDNPDGNPDRQCRYRQRRPCMAAALCMTCMHACMILLARRHASKATDCHCVIS